MNRSDLILDLSRILLPQLVEVASKASREGPMTEAKLSVLCSRPANTAAERIVDELARRVRAEGGK